MKTLIFTTAALSLIGTLGLSIQGAWSDDDEHRFSFMQFSPSGVEPVSNKLYADECGSCHFAYPAGLLPADSWKKIISGLEDHFGDNAELDAEPRKEITNYLVNNAADTSNYRRSRAIMASLRTTSVTPLLRITDTPYFKREHREISSKIINLPEVGGSLSQCNSCHQKADKGSFNEHEIAIKGFGRWED